MVGYHLHIEGLEPGCVLNNPAGMSQDTGAKRKQTVYVPEVEAERLAFRLKPSKQFKKGELYVPGNFIRASLIEGSKAGFQVKLGGARPASPKPWLAGSSVIVPELVGFGVEDAEVYTTTAVVNRARIQRSRLRLFPWSLTFDLVFSDADPLLLDVAYGLRPVMREMWVVAGIKCGLLDNRPSSPKCPGPHGRYLVKQCEFFES